MEPIKENEATVRDVLERFYGPLVRTWKINHTVYELLGQLVTKSAQCTRAMHLVPRPWDLSNPFRWAQKQVRQAFIRWCTSKSRQAF
jgi:hypothetical protein